MFAKYGELGHVLLAPGNTLALVGRSAWYLDGRLWRSLTFTRYTSVSVPIQRN